MYSDVAIIIPSRIGSTRLLNKPLVHIGDLSLIEHVVFQLHKVFKKNVYVATDSIEIASQVEAAGAIAIMTDENCPSGSDRVFEAFEKIPNRDEIKYIINVQGDMPFINATVIQEIISILRNTEYDIVTSAIKVDQSVAISSSNVKVVVNNTGKVLYFSRSLIPHGATEFLYHVGIYGFQREALEKFVSLEQSENEMTEKLEQLRALDNGMNIGVCFSDEIPISVDTEEDLEKAREYYTTVTSEEPYAT